MGHNLTNRDSGLAAVRRFQAPNLIILTRARRVPVPSLLRAFDEDEEEKAPRDVDASAKGTKSEIRGKSVKSSLNLARVLSSLDWKKHGQCVHVSLTYWKVWPASKDDLARAKQALVMSLSRHVECGIWCLEYQKRMAPHWHALVWLGGRDAGDFEQWLRAWWARFSGNPHERGVNVTSGDQARGTWYLATHAAKRAQSPPFAVGRWWGYIQRETLLGAQDIHETGEAPERERVWWARLYRRSTGCKTRNSQGLSWFLPRAWQTVAGSWIRDKIDAEMFKRSAPRNPF